MNWSGEGETREASLCLEYRNSTWTPWELKTKEVFTLLLYAILNAITNFFTIILFFPYKLIWQFVIDKIIESVINKSDFFTLVCKIT
jgi:hypothetical protein